MNIKYALKKLGLFYLGMVLLILVYSLFSLLGLLSPFFNKLVLFIINVLYYALWGLYIAKNKKILFKYSLIILIINIILSFIIKFSFKSIIYLILMYLILLFSYLFKNKKSVNH
ncbi:MAG: hypothetical protein J5892_05505 [Bacilli bacterium]|nr:hypothetical protein [Bacilli bacterium]